MIDQTALTGWLERRLEPALDAAERYQGGWLGFSCDAQQRRDDDLAELRAFVQCGCPECPLGYREGTVDALLLHLMIVLDSNIHPRLRRLRERLRQLAAHGLVPDQLHGAGAAPAYAPLRRVVPVPNATAAGISFQAARLPS